jgi:Phage integrase family
MRGKSAERGGPISPIDFHRLIQRVGEAAKMPFPIHPHMLRHACGFKLANDGHDTWGFRPIASRTFGEANEACAPDAACGLSQDPRAAGTARAQGRTPQFVEGNDG